MKNDFNPESPERGVYAINMDGIVKKPVGEIKPVDTGFGIKDWSIFDAVSGDFAKFSIHSELLACRILQAIDNKNDAELDKLLSQPIEGLLPLMVADDDPDGVLWNIEPKDALLQVHRDLFKFLVKYARMADEQKQMLAVSRNEYRKKAIATAQQRREISSIAGRATAAINPVTQSIQTELKPMWLEYKKEEEKSPKEKRKFKNLSALFRAYQLDYGNQSDFNTLRKNVKNWEAELKVNSA